MRRTSHHHANPSRHNPEGGIMHDAARLRNVKMARLLLEKGANPDARDKDNQTPLDWCHASNRKNTAEMVKVFREHHARNDKRE
jgi:ankyrin repeat protein